MRVAGSRSRADTRSSRTTRSTSDRGSDPGGRGQRVWHTHLFEVFVSKGMMQSFYNDLLSPAKGQTDLDIS